MRRRCSVPAVSLSSRHCRRCTSPRLRLCLHVCDYMAIPLHALLRLRSRQAARRAGFGNARPLLPTPHNATAPSQQHSHALPLQSPAPVSCPRSRVPTGPTAFQCSRDRRTSTHPPPNVATQPTTRSLRPADSLSGVHVHTNLTLFVDLGGAHACAHQCQLCSHGFSVPAVQPQLLSQMNAVQVWHFLVHTTAVASAHQWGNSLPAPLHQ